MRYKGLCLATLVLSLTVAAPTVAVAEEPDAQIGRKLPDGVRTLMFARACDVPQEDTERPCAKDGDCVLTRSNGNAYRAYVPDWMSAFFLHFQVGATVLSPALEFQGVMDKVENPSHWGEALAMLSGIPFQLDDEGKVDPNPWPRAMHPNPALVRWIGRELIPSPETRMCGATAQVLYDHGFRGMVRQMATIYVDLKKSGHLAKVSIDELEKNANTRKGRYAKRCMTLAAKEKSDEARNIVDYGCGWWLRRYAGPGKRGPESAAAMVSLLGDVLRQYDGEWFKSVAKHFPKPVETPAP